MVADDGDHVHVQLTDAVAIEQVAQAVVELADHQHDLARGILAPQVPGHAVFRGQRFEPGANRAQVRAARIEGHAHEEVAAVLIVELLRLQNISAVFKQITGNARGDPGTVAAGQGEDLDLGHQQVSHCGAAP